MSACGAGAFPLTMSACGQHLNHLRAWKKAVRSIRHIDSGEEISNEVFNFTATCPAAVRSSNSRVADLIMPATAATAAVDRRDCGLDQQLLTRGKKNASNRFQHPSEGTVSIRLVIPLKQIPGMLKGPNGFWWSRGVPRATYLIPKPCHAYSQSGWTRPNSYNVPSVRKSCKGRIGGLQGVVLVYLESAQILLSLMHESQILLSFLHKILNQNT